MRRTATLALAGVALTAAVAVAANVHFKPRDPTFRDNGTTLTATGSLAGLGNGDITITLQATGTASTTGYNQGGNAAPGQNVGVTVTGTTTISADKIENGQVFVAVSTPEPRQPTATEAGFPNNNWTAVITDVKFTTATITVVQGGQIVFKKTYKL
ncbi:MAG TPA: hypothetical protein VM597_08325 [Gemmataceae bacterium]|jgi:hypothetical protein|nr:hypothetical protein [Gemmataceae bacterium]